MDTFRGAPDVADEDFIILGEPLDSDRWAEREGLQTSQHALLKLLSHA